MTDIVRILLVEDCEGDVALLRAALQMSKNCRFEVSAAGTMDEALVRIRNEDFDLALLDLGLPDSDGIATLKRLRAASQQVPVVVLTGIEDETLGIDAIEHGAQDYLFKGHIVGDLLHRVIRHSIARQKQLVHYENEARIDALTRLPNRRSFDFELSRNFAAWRRNETPFSLLLIDVDHFKRLNDAHGHLAGDRELCRIAESFESVVRQEDLVARYGGEEFAVVMPGVGVEAACEIGERVRRGVVQATHASNGGHSMTVSVGAAEVLPDEDEPGLIHRADMALYAAKIAGRDCVFFHNGSVARPAGCSISTKPRLAEQRVPRSPSPNSALLALNHGAVIPTTVN